MTKITAQMVGDLRVRTGVGMMECKKALQATDGDMDKAAEELRKSGKAKADKKAGRVAAEGAIVIAHNNKQAAMVEINSETDFVARDDNFTSFAAALADTVLDAKETNVDAIANLALKGRDVSVEEARQTLVGKVGENVQVRRAAVSGEAATCVGTYLHGNRIGVIVELDIDNQDLARDVAMHIAASKPIVVSPDSVPEELVAKEKEIFMAQAATSGKPVEIIEKMVAGRLKKFLDEVSLTGQPFVKDPDVTVGSLLKKQRGKVLAFYRYEVGEGIEKVTEDFKEAVMQQVQNG